MNTLHNNNGIALVTSLLFTLISLGIVMALLTIVLQGTRLSGANKAYRSATEASYGAVDFIAKDLIPAIFTDKFDLAYKEAMLDAINMEFPLEACFNEKITKSTSEWSACTGSPTTPVATESPDITFNLKADLGDAIDPAGYLVHAKIVDTRCGGDATQPCTNSDTSGIDYLDAGGGVASASGAVTPQHRPAYYRIEVQSEKTNTQQKSQLSVLYAY